MHSDSTLSAACGHAIPERAQLAGALSDPTRHHELLTEAHRLFSEMDATGHAERTAALLAKGTH